MEQDFKINTFGLLFKCIQATLKSDTVACSAKIPISYEHWDSPTLHSPGFIMMVFLH